MASANPDTYRSKSYAGADAGETAASRAHAQRGGTVTAVVHGPEQERR